MVRESYVEDAEEVIFDEDCVCGEGWCLATSFLEIEGMIWMGKMKDGGEGCDSKDEKTLQADKVVLIITRRVGSCHII